MIKSHFAETAALISAMHAHRSVRRSNDDAHWLAVIDLYKRKVKAGAEHFEVDPLTAAYLMSRQLTDDDGKSTIDRVNLIAAGFELAIMSKFTLN